MRVGGERNQRREWTSEYEEVDSTRILDIKLGDGAKGGRRFWGKADSEEVCCGRSRGGGEPCSIRYYEYKACARIRQVKENMISGLIRDWT